MTKLKQDYMLVKDTSEELADRLFERAFLKSKARIIESIIEENVGKAGRILFLEAERFFKSAADKIQDAKK